MCNTRAVQISIFETYPDHQMAPLILCGLNHLVPVQNYHDYPPDAVVV